MVNKRHLPDYYDIIKEPIALSSIKTKINNKEYLTVKDFVRDFALVCGSSDSSLRLLILVLMFISYRLRIMHLSIICQILEHIKML